jgi:peptidyl-prolyl cis-trans isomerase B (cyclophilin B)
MKKRNHGRKATAGIAPASPPAPLNQENGGSSTWFSLPWAILGSVLAVVLGAWLWLRFQPPGEPTPPEKLPDPDISAQAQPKKDPEQPADKQPDSKPSGKETGGGLLGAFGKKDSDDPSQVPLLATDELEKRFHKLLDLRQRHDELTEKVAAWQGAVDKSELQAILSEKKRLDAQFNKELAPYNNVLKRAREARPDDAALQWLTAEVQMMVGSEPDEIVPHLRRAIEQGISRPRAFASLARVLIDLNKPEEAYQAAGKALELDGASRDAWTVFCRAGCNSERFAEVVARLDRAFPGKQPPWVEALRREAAEWETLWQSEQKLRLDDQRADLPRVRLFIEHRRFALADKDGGAPRIETTGKEEVVLELFEDQAPATVANFLTLVSEKKYDGTRFHLAIGGAFVAGGDLASRSDDPRNDGKSNPDHDLPDESGRRDVRHHFRGALSRVSRGPQTSGSQFLITTVPQRDREGLTVFGRVIQGQEVIDRITLGRTNQDLATGKIIPGDLLVRAEVIRKRPHEDGTSKERPR